ncbi:MAG: hypothetical protein Q4G14_10765 [Paracoccus sp. (in: a-proteobacteria)]|uniref:cupin domain-containing protein n=1 Tax=Paracoccus sp. TaxID=267 RepID=UPI0026E0352D|nr:hypothetical protein [Paracoccus sp. (in: a-proteobacteria)]MDO5613705.1 hypothetical protein [Paracoccus sp. (in: a-proteobacteria)]
MTDSARKVTIHTSRDGDDPVPLASGDSFQIIEMSGSGPGYLHRHLDDDVAFHLISGRLRFRLADGNVDVPPASTVFIPAGAAYDFDEIMPSRYLMIGTPRLRKLAEALRGAARDRHPDILREYESEIVV